MRLIPCPSNRRCPFDTEICPGPGELKSEFSVTSIRSIPPELGPTTYMCMHADERSTLVDLIGNRVTPMQKRVITAMGGTLTFTLRPAPGSLPFAEEQVSIAPENSGDNSRTE